MFNAFKFDPKALATETKAMRERLQANKGTDDLAEYGAGVIARFVEKKPIRYRDFGPYWWAVKSILIKKGLAKGTTANDIISTEYCGSTDHETIAAAQLFADYYLGTYFIGTNTFELNQNSDEVWTLYDPDYEQPQ